MSNSLPSPASESCHVSSVFWNNQYAVLRRLVGKWVYSAHLTAWVGEEEEVIADLVQEAMCRMVERLDKAERQEAPPVKSPDFMSRAISRNLFIDRWRKDKRIVPLSQLTRFQGDGPFEFELADNAEDVNERVFREALFNAVAPEIAQLPKKQKWTLLVDMARHTNFIENESMLRQALSKVDIRLEDYQGWQAANSVERSRFASLLSIAYKRIVRSNCVKQYLKR